MANMYVGVKNGNNIESKLVKNIYVGVNNNGTIQAKKVLKGYVGVKNSSTGNIEAKLFYQASN